VAVVAHGPHALEGGVPHGVRHLRPQERCAHGPQTVRIADHVRPSSWVAQVIHNTIHTCG
jgi:hypothetical protein